MNMTYRRQAWSGSALNGGRNANHQPLTEDQLRSLAPSIFAEDKHESRSDRYTYIPTFEIVQGLQAEGFQPMAAVQGRTRIPGKAAYTKHMIRFQHLSKLERIGQTIPEIVLINSHDGTSSYQIMAGLLEVLCLNGLLAAKSVLDDVRVGHTGNIKDKVIEGTYSVLGQIDRVLERPKTWREIEVHADEARALARAVHTLRLEDASEQTRQLIRPESFLEPRRPEDRKNDLWTTFNRLQENTIRGEIQGRGWVTDDRGRRVHRRTQTRAIRNIDQNVHLNRALWVLAEEFAKLKAAA